MDLLRSSGLPIPKVYRYSPESDNAAGTEYIFMEFVRGTKLSDVWFDLGKRQVISVVCQLTQLESKMMLISFPAGRSLYYAQDLEKVAGGTGYPARGRMFLRRSRCTIASVVWQEITARRRPGTMYAAFCLLLLLRP